MTSCVLDTTSFFVFASAARLTTHTLQQNTSHCTEGWSEQQQVHSKVLAKPVSKACQQRTTSVSKEQLGTRTPVSKEQHQALEPARLSTKNNKWPDQNLGTRTPVSTEQHQALEPARPSTKNNQWHQQNLGTRTPVTKDQETALEPARLSAKINWQAPPNLGTRTPVSKEQQAPDPKPWNPHACQQRTTMCSFQNLKTRRRYCYLRGPSHQKTTKNLSNPHACQQIIGANGRRAHYEPSSRKAQR